MEKRVYYKYLFIIGAIWNIVLSIYALIFPGEPRLSGESLMYYQGFVFLALVFGIGYFMVGIDIDKNHGIVIMGIIGKILVFILSLAYFLSGATSIDFAIIGVGDLIFAILFLEFLLNYKKL